MRALPWLLFILSACQTTPAPPPSFVAPRVDPPTPEVEIVPAPPSPRRVAFSIETVAAAEPGTSAPAPNSVSLFRTEVMDEFRRAGWQVVAVRTGPTAWQDATTVGAAKLVKGSATFTSVNPSSVAVSSFVFLVDAVVSLRVVDVATSAEVGGFQGPIRGEKGKMPVLSFDRTVTDIVHLNAARVAQPMLQALGAPP